MPLYEYKCAACGKVFEVIQKFVDEPLHVHPEFVELEAILPRMEAVAAELEKDV